VRSGNASETGLPYKERMRIAALVTQPRGGPVDHAVDVACELAARGHDSHLIGPVDASAARLAAAGVIWHDITVASKGDVRGARNLRRLLRDLRADVLHCQDMRAGMVGRLVGFGAARSIVYTVHGVPDTLSDLVPGNARVSPRRRGDRLRYLTAERWLARLTHARLVAPSTQVADYLVRHVGIPDGTVTVVPNGIDPDRFTPGSRPGGDGVVALWLGLMGPIKRVDLLVRAAAQIPQLSLLLVGGGPEQERVQQLVAQLHVADRVEVRGHVADPAPVFGEADLFALPSAAEACPLALLQAMSCGLPVVASNVGGIPDVVRPEVEGLLVDASDTVGFTAALRALVTDADRRRTMGGQARERIISAYSLKICVDKLLEVYSG
jgi:glycosyltransferase involved in cell wall biosynthesis